MVCLSFHLCLWFGEILYTGKQSKKKKTVQLSAEAIMTLLGLYLLDVTQLIWIPKIEFLDPGNEAAYFLASALKSSGS